MKRDKQGHYMMIKGSIQEEDITIINVYAPNIGAPQYVREILTSMKGENMPYCSKNTCNQEYSIQQASHSNSIGRNQKLYM